MTSRSPVCDGATLRGPTPSLQVLVMYLHALRILYEHIGSVPACNVTNKS